MLPEIILSDTKNSILFIEKRIEKDVVVAAPHHAPLGTQELPCPEHKNADENVGFLAYYTSKLLNCSVVIACNYFIDCNKCDDSDYFKIISKWNPKILIEIHGHGGISSEYDIEISSGRKENDKSSIRLAECIKSKTDEISKQKKYSISGDYDKIHFKARDSKTITTDKWIAFHIELPKTLRSNEIEFKIFCEILSSAIKDILNKNDSISENIE